MHSLSRNVAFKREFWSLLLNKICRLVVLLSMPRYWLESKIVLFGCNVNKYIQRCSTRCYYKKENRCCIITPKIPIMMQYMTWSNLGDVVVKTRLVSRTTWCQSAAGCMPRCWSWVCIGIRRVLCIESETQGRRLKNGTHIMPMPHPDIPNDVFPGSLAGQEEIGEGN